MKRKWEIVPEGDTDNGEPTCWALEINHEAYGKYVWINGLLDDDDKIIQYDIEVIPSRGESIILAECKSLASAKRWVTMNLL